MLCTWGEKQKEISCQLNVRNVHWAHRDTHTHTCKYRHTFILNHACTLTANSNQLFNVPIKKEIRLGIEIYYVCMCADDEQHTIEAFKIVWHLCKNPVCVYVKVYIRNVFFTRHSIHVWMRVCVLLYFHKALNARIHKRHRWPNKWRKLRVYLKNEMEKKTATETPKQNRQRTQKYELDRKKNYWNDRAVHNRELKVAAYNILLHKK